MNAPVSTNTPVPRPVEVSEWSKYELVCSPNELVSLATIPNEAVQVQVVSPTKVRLRTNSVVGRFRTSAIDLIIRPKLAIDSLLYLLGEVYGIEKLHDEFASYKSKIEVDELLVSIFLNYVTKLIRQGVHKKYVSLKNQLTSVRGRIDVRRTTALFYRGNPCVECEFDEHSYDCIENQIIKATLGVLLSRSVKSSVQRQAIWSLYKELGNVKELPPNIALKSDVVRNRLNQHYFPAIPLARIILSSMGVMHDYGSVEMDGFHVDMNLLYERYIERRLRNELTYYGVSVDAQNSSPFDKQRQAMIRPDLILQSNLGRRLVADTKYKVTNQPDRNDLYQVLSYCQVLGIPKGVLITVGDLVDRHYSVSDNTTSIDVFPVSMNGNAEMLEKHTRILAEKLLSLISTAS